VRGLLGSIIDTVLVRGLLALEAVYPMPARLGAPLPPGSSASAQADPVVLVGGFANSPSGWAEWRRSLEADGFRVFVFDPPTTGLGDMHDSARAVAAFIEQVRRRTGRRKVDVIGFSEGGLLTRMAIASHGALDAVDRAISLATPHLGVPLRPLHDALSGLRLLVRAVPPAAIQLLEGSELVGAVERSDRHLRSGAIGAPRYASIFSRTIDLLVWPHLAWLPGAFNIPVDDDRPGRAGPNHFEMLHTSDRSYEAARILLLDGSPRAAAIAGLRSLAGHAAQG
jgi:pimeloyl-ACP methyl ester carboxylesterase